MKTIYERIVELEKALGSRAKEYSIFFSDLGATPDSDAALLMNRRTDAHGRAWHLWLRLSTRFPRFAKKLLTRGQRAAIRRTGMKALFALYEFLTLRRVFSNKKESETRSDKAMYGLAAPVYSRKIYHEFATLYYERGNADYAGLLWRMAEELNDATVDSLAVQAALFSPTATNESLLAGQKRWAERHARPLDGLAPIRVTPYRGDRKIRIGYFCSFFDTDVVRAMFSSVVERRDRQKFTAVAYSVSE